MNSGEHGPSEVERFALANDAPRKPPARFEDAAGTQRMLLAGLDCLPGQANLFQTDGEGDSAGDE